MTSLQRLVAFFTFLLACADVYAPTVGFYFQVSVVILAYFALVFILPIGLYLESRNHVNPC